MRKSTKLMFCFWNLPIAARVNGPIKPSVVSAAPVPLTDTDRIERLLDSENVIAEIDRALPH
jgi:hypothetical protein